MTDLFVIVTRVVNAKGNIIKHAYGPYVSRPQAQAEVNAMKRRHARDGSADDNDIEISVCKIIDILGMNGQ
jgi:hypothetical protein